MIAVGFFAPFFLRQPQPMKASDCGGAIGGLPRTPGILEVTHNHKVLLGHLFGQRRDVLSTTIQTSVAALGKGVQVLDLIERGRKRPGVYFKEDP